MLHIIIIHNELALIDLFRPRLMVSLEFFQDVFFRFFYNSALFFASCCSSFFLHVVANFICIFFVSRQLVLLSALPISSFLLWSKRVYPDVLLKSFISIDVNHFLIFFF